MSPVTAKRARCRKSLPSPVTCHTSLASACPTRLTRPTKQPVATDLQPQSAIV
jgi:hypothetical protein